MDGIEAEMEDCLVVGWTVARRKGGTERLDNTVIMKVTMLVRVFDR